MMYIYRYKNYDFDNDFLPLGFVWKEPEIYAPSQPADTDYEIYEDKDYHIAFIKERYRTNQTNGNEYFLYLSAVMMEHIQSADISLEQAEIFGVALDRVGIELQRGFYDSAYKSLIAADYPTDPILIQVYDMMEVYLREYINDKYPDVFYIPPP